MSLNKNIDFNKVRELLKTEDVVIVDNFLDISFANILCNRMHGASYDHHFEMGYYAQDYYYLQDKHTTTLVDDLKNRMGLKNFQRAWSFIYDNGEGVPFHADPASLNINIWVAPNDCIEDFSSNGLIITDLKPPSDWTREMWNNNKNLCINNLFRNSKFKTTTIDYKFNRGVFFDGALFHRTDKVKTKPGEENKRVSYTMLYGRELE